MRIARSTINDKYIQPLKLRISDRLVVAPNADYNSILLRNTHRRKDKSNIKVKLHCKFDTENFDGIQLRAFLSDDNINPISSGSCVFRVYKISNDDLWTETLDETISGVLSGSKFTAQVPQSNLTIDLDGELTFSIEATLTRLGKEYKEKIWVNHLGVYDSIVRLRNKINFLSITKKDFGV